MKIYVGAPGTLRYYDVIKEKRLGVLISASSWRNVKESVPFWVLDNGAYSYYVNQKPFVEDRFLKALVKAKKQHTEPDFIVVPDIPTSSESLDFSLSWLVRLEGEYDNLYLAVQNGMENTDVRRVLSEYDKTVSGLFVGGTDSWKLRTGRMWCRIAHEHGKKCHVGRVGTARKIAWALRIGCDSVDSTTFVQGPAPVGRFKNIELGYDMYQHLVSLDHFSSLFGGGVEC